jgi:energy-coupling factor transporter transmembrane protein EcfT
MTNFKIKKVNNNYIKCGILSFLGLLTLKMNIHFGDYCFGAPDVIQWFFYSFIFILASIIIVVYGLIKKKSDSKIYIIISVVILLNLFFIALQFNKLDDKDAALIGTVNTIGRNREIILNENKSFVIILQQPEWACYQKGNYEIKENILTLKKDNLIQETDSLFTYKYKIDLKNKVLIPLEKGFNTITIKSTNKTP